MTLVFPGEPIIWNFSSANPDVTEFLIVFDDPSAVFFNGNSAFSKPQLGPTFVYGKAPFSTAGRRDKYTVKGLDSSGTTVAYLDPMIITVQ